jgi:hypothetical protein
VVGTSHTPVTPRDTTSAEVDYDVQHALFRLL